MNSEANSSWAKTLDSWATHAFQGCYKETKKQTKENTDQQQQHDNHSFLSYLKEKPEEIRGHLPARVACIHNQAHSLVDLSISRHQEDGADDVKQCQHQTQRAGRHNLHTWVHVAENLQQGWKLQVYRD